VQREALSRRRGQSVRGAVTIACALACIPAVPAVAGGATLVTGGGELRPSTLPETRYAPAWMHVEIHASTDDPSGVPDRLSKVELNLDDDGRITTNGLPMCKPARIRHATTRLALRECGRARVGRGEATVVISVGQGHTTADAVVNVFNGTRLNGDPRVLFHARADFGYTQLMVGTIRSSSAGSDFGKVLSATIPPIQLGAVISDLDIRVRKTWRFRGQRQSYISARCHDPDRTLNVHARFELSGGALTQTGDVAQTCSVQR
jgi:hypothetical protein